MKVLADLHHGDLYYSLQLLFEKRLGWEMYRPIGLEWYHAGYWHVFPHIDTANQYLGLDHAINPPKNCHGDYLSPREILNKNYRYEDGIYYVKDPTKDKVQRGITLDKFRDMEFDILVSSIPQHVGPFNKLIRLYQPQAKHIFQVGNAWNYIPGIQNILASTAPFYTPPGVNVVNYHQEFDLEMFKYTPPTNHKRVDSYIHYMKELSLLEQYKKSLPDWGFYTHGAGMENCLQKSQAIADTYISSGWTWHVKPEGDGYGYGGHCSAACGRPLIIRGDYYRGKLLSLLLEDKKTCINLDQHPLHENIKLLQYFSQPEEHRTMCENIYKKFREVVDFDQEEQHIRRFLERII